MFVPRYSEEEARRAVAASPSYTEAFRRLGVKPAGGNHKLFRRWVDDVWQIPTERFDPDHARDSSFRKRTPVPLEAILVECSTYKRASLKRRLYEAGLKERRCELCGQGEEWRGRRMSLIIDHVNGVPDDNRLENLRIVCPNCAATLDTHCGRKNRQPVELRSCPVCEGTFTPRYARHRYCSRACASRHSTRRRAPKPSLRKVTRPSLEQLRLDLEAMSCAAVGRKYGVSDTAVRKWLRAYEEEGDSRRVL